MGERVVNQGPINMSYVMNALVSWAGNSGPSRCVSWRTCSRVTGLRPAGR
jgi:hypothetical protein